MYIDLLEWNMTPREARALYAQSVALYSTLLRMTDNASSELMIQLGWLIEDIYDGFMLEGADDDTAVYTETVRQWRQNNPEWYAQDNLSDTLLGAMVVDFASS